VPLTDARRLSPEGQEDLRRRVVAAIASGMTQVEAARVFGVSRRAVGVWTRAHRTHGPDALRAHRRGRPPGEQHALTRRAQADLLLELTAGPPDLHGLPGQWWSRRAVADLIQLQTGRRLSPTTVGHYLTRWNIGATPISGPHPVSLVGHTTAWWLTWHRPIPKYLNSELLPEPAQLDALLAQSARGDLLFLLSRTPWQPAELADAGARLVRTVGHPVHLLIRRWPTEHVDLLRRWVDEPGPDLRLTLA